MLGSSNIKGLILIVSCLYTLNPSRSLLSVYTRLLIQSFAQRFMPGYPQHSPKPLGCSDYNRLPSMQYTCCLNKTGYYVDSLAIPSGLLIMFSHCTMLGRRTWLLKRDTNHHRLLARICVVSACCLWMIVSHLDLCKRLRRIMIDITGILNVFWIVVFVYMRHEA